MLIYKKKLIEKYLILEDISIDSKLIKKGNAIRIIIIRTCLVDSINNF